MFIISVSGEAGSGKDTLVNILSDILGMSNIDCQNISFADPLKDALVAMFKWDRERLQNDFFYKEGGLEGDDACVYCQKLGKTRRVIMQEFGTEAVRNNIGFDTWVLIAEHDTIPNMTTDVGFISDARFFNELELTERHNGIRIRIDRIDDNASTKTTKDEHASENQWKQYKKYNYIVYNSYDNSTPESVKESYENLRSQATTIANEILRLFEYRRSQ